jgi:hypothetical protein
VVILYPSLFIVSSIYMFETQLLTPCYKPLELQTSLQTRRRFATEP